MARHLGWMVMALLAPLAAHAEKIPVAPEVAAKLHAADPSAPWGSGWSERADVTCHGQKDILVVTHDAHKVWLGIVRTAQYTTHAQTMALQWPLAHGIQDAFCAVPTKIAFYPRTCKEDDGRLPGCKPIPGCMAFSIAGDERDGLNFYWDAAKHGLRWWRR